MIFVIKCTFSEVCQPGEPWGEPWDGSHGVGAVGWGPPGWEPPRMGAPPGPDCKVFSVRGEWVSLPLRFARERYEITDWIMRDHIQNNVCLFASSLILVKEYLCSKCADYSKFRKNARTGFEERVPRVYPNFAVWHWLRSWKLRQSQVLWQTNSLNNYIMVRNNKQIGPLNLQYVWNSTRFGIANQKSDPQ